MYSVAHCAILIVKSARPGLGSRGGGGGRGFVRRKEKEGYRLGLGSGGGGEGVSAREKRKWDRRHEEGGSVPAPVLSLCTSKNIKT